MVSRCPGETHVWATSSDPKDSEATSGRAVLESNRTRSQSLRSSPALRTSRNPDAGAVQRETATPGAPGRREEWQVRGTALVATKVRSVDGAAPGMDVPVAVVTGTMITAAATADATKMLRMQCLP